MELKKARIKNISSDQTRSPDGVPVMFNPTELTITRNANYAEIAVPGLQMPLLQFIRGDSQTLSVELFLDRSDTGRSVAPRPPGEGGTTSGGADALATGRIEADLSYLRELVTIDGAKHAPPVCEFQWWDTTFKGVVTSFTEKFTLFDDQGTVMRARVSLTFKSYVPAEVQYALQNPQSPDRTRVYVVRESERLDLIAFREYGDSSAWPVLARANNITRPRFLEPGTVLVIPSL